MKRRTFISAAIGAIGSLFVAKAPNESTANELLPCSTFPGDRVEIDGKTYKVVNAMRQWHPIYSGHGDELAFSHFQCTDNYGLVPINDKAKSQ